MENNDVMRQQYRILTMNEKETIAEIKAMAEEMYVYLNDLGSSRELSIALTKMEECVMWATKHITK